MTSPAGENVLESVVDVIKGPLLLHDPRPASGREHHQHPRYDSVVTDSTTAQGLLDAFAAKLVETLQDEAPMHRLWYDLRTQSMFLEPLREVVTMIDKTLEDMIWRVVSRYVELSGRTVAMTPAAAYGVLDGVFQQALLAHISGSPTALDDLAPKVHALMPLVLAA